MLTKHFKRQSTQYIGDSHPKDGRLKYLEIKMLQSLKI